MVCCGLGAECSHRARPELCGEVYEMDNAEKQNLLNTISWKKQELNQAREELDRLREKDQTLADFSAECSKRIAAFDASMARRRGKLSQLSSLLARVRSASKYSERMNALLTGKDNQDAVASINGLQGSISEQKRAVSQNLLDTEERIRRLENEIEALQYEYNTYPEESDNG